MRVRIPPRSTNHKRSAANRPSVKPDEWLTIRVPIYPVLVCRNLVYGLALEASARKGLWVRLPLPVPNVSLSFNGRTVASKPTGLGSNPSRLANQGLV